MLVVDHAARLVKHLPAALPGHIAQVAVFQVEGLQQPVETAQFEKLFAIECARAAAAVEAREQIGHGWVDAVAHAQSAVFPPALREAGFLAKLGGVAEKDLARDGEDAGFAEAIEKRRQKIRGHAHVAVQQDDDAVLRGAEARVRSAAEAEILFQRDQLHLGKSPADELGAAVGRSVIDDDDFVGGVCGESFDYRWQILFEQVSAVPIGDHRGGAWVRGARTTAYSVPTHGDAFFAPVAGTMREQVR